MSPSRSLLSAVLAAAVLASTVAALPPAQGEASSSDAQLVIIEAGKDSPVLEQQLARAGLDVRGAISSIVVVVLADSAAKALLVQHQDSFAATVRVQHTLFPRSALDNCRFAVAESLRPHERDALLSSIQRAGSASCPGSLLWASDSMAVFTVSHSFSMSSAPREPLAILPSHALVPLAQQEAAAAFAKVEQRPDARILKLISAINVTKIRNNVIRLGAFHTRHSRSDAIHDAQSFLVEQLFSLGYEPFLMPYQVEGVTWPANILVDIAPSSAAAAAADGDEVLIIGAHYDCRQEDSSSANKVAPGADDNASGVAAMLEIARVLALFRDEIGFSTRIRIALWSGEEQGLFGSAAYAKWAARHGLNIKAYLNNDMLGYRPTETSILGLKDRFVSGWVNDVIISTYKTYFPGAPIGFSPSCCSDQQSFHAAGFAAAAFFESELTASDNPNYHSVTDTWDTLDYDQMEQFTGAAIATLASMANPV